MFNEDRQSVVDRLVEFQAAVRDVVAGSRSRRGGPSGPSGSQGGGLHKVSRESAADTIYEIDTLVEPLLEDFCREWGRTTPLVLVAEGLEGGSAEGVKVYPEGTPEEDARLRLLVDPIDGTRGLMYDKHPAWALAAVAPNRGAATRLRDAEVAVMTELPTSKMGFGDVLWAVKRRGAHGRRVDLTSRDGRDLPLRPSAAGRIDHGFAMVSDFFPGTKVLAAELTEFLVANLIPAQEVGKATVFADQYISTGGQFYELVVGHDRFNADLRPLFYRMQGLPEGLCCHPYDCAALLIAEEAGVIVTDAAGSPLDGPLDVTTGITWAGYANETLRRSIEPLLTRWVEEMLRDA